MHITYLNKTEATVPQIQELADGTLLVTASPAFVMRLTSSGTVLTGCGTITPTDEAVADVTDTVEGADLAEWNNVNVSVTSEDITQVERPAVDAPRLTCPN